jgi:hypothetical protein
MIPKAFLALVGAVALNVFFVFMTVVGREDGQSKAGDPIKPGVVDEPMQTQPDALNGLPEVPSLPAELPSAFSTVEDLEAVDPAYLDSATELFPQLKKLRGSRHTPTLEYFSALEQRLATVRQLTVAAERLSRDAMRIADSDPKLAERYLQMITQLRDMASNLLVEELR